MTVTPSAWLASALAKELKNRRWPSDAEFEDRWTRGQIYGSRACQIILESLERRYEHHEAAPFTEIQIEHIMPQVLTPDWENRLGSEFARTHADWLHTIGNLTLTGYNPELSNKPYPEKRAVYALSHFELNRYFGTCDEWNAMQIGRRAAKLFGIALQLWPRPSLVNTESAAANDKLRRLAFTRNASSLSRAIWALTS